jgi:NADH:ubiquinone reductase (non-electrogenic)
VRPTASMAMKPLATFSVSAASRQLVQQRAFASVPRNALNTARNQRKTLAQQCRRGYAEQNTVAGVPGVPGPGNALPKMKKKRAGVLRWAWRLTYLSAIGMLGFSAYGIYVNRHPVEQQEPDPSKKTLVVLGRSHAIATSQ